MTKRPYSYRTYQLLGTINLAYLGSSKDKQPFYYLEIEWESLFIKSKETIYVFANLVDKEVWNTLEKHTYKDKKYLFFCEKRVRGWRLKSWEEKNHLTTES